MLPPGPSHPAFWQTYRFVTDPLAYSREMMARYGKTLRARALNGAGIITSDPEMIKLVFAADPETFETLPVMGELLGPMSVIATFGATHRRQRKLLNARFHGAQMRQLLQAMQRVTSEKFEALAHARTTGATVVMIDLAQDLTLDVILEVVFGATSGLDRAEVRRVIKGAITALAPSFISTPVLRKPWNPAWRRFRAARVAFDSMVGARIARRRAAASTGSDLLGALLEARYDDGAEMESSEIQDQLFTILFAGHETTAVTLAWAAYWLAREPRVLQRLRAELATVARSDLEGTQKLPYLDAVCRETQRIEPVLSDITRVCKKPLALGPYTVPAGELIFVNSCMLMRDEALYPEPLRFRPERFLERAYGPSEFTPFGGGQRRCLGAAFAEAELRVAVSTLAREWELSLADATPEKAVRRNLTMGPKRGVRVRVVGRRADAEERGFHAA
jgi:cytochrome P450